MKVRGTSPYHATSARCAPRLRRIVSIAARWRCAFGCGVSTEIPFRGGRENATRDEADQRKIEQLARQCMVPSPGGWRPPMGRIPGWNWLPAEGIRPRLDRAPAWVRVWVRIPLVDRFAYGWMWHNGMWDVIPPNASDVFDNSS